MQHAAVLDVFDLDLGIDPAQEVDLLHRAIRVGERRLHGLARGQVALQPGDRHRLVTGQAQRFAGVAAGELERDDAHADEVGAVDALEALGDDRADVL